MVEISNKDIRTAMLGLHQYEVAEQLGVTETAFSRLLRKEMSPERRKQVLQAIKILNEGGK